MSQRISFGTLFLAVVSIVPQLRSAEPLYYQQDVFVSGHDDVVEYRIPALVRSSNGNLIAVCDARVSRPGDAPNNIDLVIKRSRDNGRNWEPLRRIVDFPGEQAACDPSLLVDQQSGIVWCMFDRIYPNLEVALRDKGRLPDGVAPGRRGRVAFLNLISSQDDGQSWSMPLDITKQLTRPDWTSVMALPGTGIQNREGHLIFPCLARLGAPGSPQQDDRAALAVSDDHGKTWCLSSLMASRTDEFHVAQLYDGRLMANLRHQYRSKSFRLVATSGDGGTTWSDLVDQPMLPDPNCQGSFIRYTSRRDGFSKNRLLFANAASTRGRANMTVRLSYDEGATWPVSRVVHAGPAAYSSMTILKDGTIGLLYEQGTKPPRDKIKFARFNLEWLTGGRDTL